MQYTDYDLESRTWISSSSLSLRFKSRRDNATTITLLCRRDNYILMSDFFSRRDVLSKMKKCREAARFLPLLLSGDVSSFGHFRGISIVKINAIISLIILEWNFNFILNDDRSSYTRLRMLQRSVCQNVFQRWRSIEKRCAWHSRFIVRR